jgi:hypothetical protein
MSDEGKHDNPLGRFVDRIEDKIENVVENVVGEPEERQRGSRRRQYVHQDERTQIPINVNVECCPPGGPGGTGGPGGPGGRGGAGGPPGRPTHQTGTSDGSVDKGVGAPGGVLGIPQRPPNVWSGPRSKLTLPFLFIRARAGDTAIRPISRSRQTARRSLTRLCTE